MRTSQKGIDLIKKYEGCRLTAYLCPANVWTIGYGHTKGVKRGQVITQAQAESYLRADIERFEAKVNKYSKYNWTQNEFDAMVSFTYNLGSIDQLIANGVRSKVVIADKILEYNKANKKVLAGLVRRRTEERALFLSGAISTEPKPTESISSNKLVEDGIMGASTKKALQKALGVTEDGVIGKGTIKALQKKLNDGTF